MNRTTAEADRYTGLTLERALVVALEESRDNGSNSFLVVESKEPHGNAQLGYRFYDVLPSFAIGVLQKKDYPVVATITAEHGASGVLVDERDGSADVLRELARRLVRWRDLTPAGRGCTDEALIELAEVARKLSLDRE